MEHVFLPLKAHRKLVRFGSNANTTKKKVFVLKKSVVNKTPCYSDQSDLNWIKENML